MIKLYDKEEEYELEDEELIIKKEEAEQLYEYLKHEYISHEFFPMVHVFINRLVKFINVT